MTKIANTLYYRMVVTKCSLYKNDENVDNSRNSGAG